MSNETPNNGQFNPQLQFSPAGLVGRMNANGVNPGMQIRNMYGTPTMANAMPNMSPGLMGQNNALSMAQRQGLGVGSPSFQLNGANPAFAALTQQQRQQFQHQQMMQHQQQLQLQQFQQQQQQQQQHQQQTPLMNNFQLQQPPQTTLSENASGTIADSSKTNPPSSQQSNNDANDDLFGLESFVDFTELGPATSKGTDSSTIISGDSAASAQTATPGINTSSNTTTNNINNGTSSNSANHTTEPDSSNSADLSNGIGGTNLNNNANANANANNNNGSNPNSQSATPSGAIFNQQAPGSQIQSPFQPNANLQLQPQQLQQNQPGNLNNLQRQQLQLQMHQQQQQQQQQANQNRNGMSPIGHNPQAMLIQPQQQPIQTGNGASPGMPFLSMEMRQQMNLLQQANQQRFQGTMEELQRRHQQALLGANGDANSIAQLNEQFENMKKQAATHQRYTAQLQMRTLQQQMLQQQGLNQSPTSNPMMAQTQQQKQQQQMLAQQSMAQQQGVFNSPPYTPQQQQQQQQQAQKQQVPMHLQGQPHLQGTPQMQHQQMLQRQQQLEQLQQQQQQQQQHLQNMGGMQGIHMPANNALANSMAARQRKPQGSQPTSAQSSPSQANASLPIINNVVPNLNIDYTTITCDEFEDQLRDFMKNRNTPLPTKIPSMGSKKINLLLLFRISMSMGGMESVSKQKAWKSISSQLDIPDTLATAAQTLRKHYSLLLHPFEEAILHAKNNGMAVHPSLGTVPVLPLPESIESQGATANSPLATGPPPQQVQMGMPGAHPMLHQQQGFHPNLQLQQQQQQQQQQHQMQQLQHQQQL
ncbi:AT-rich interactive domain-containing protein 5B, partial [Dissophora globulifera]